MRANAVTGTTGAVLSGGYDLVGGVKTESNPGNTTLKRRRASDSTWTQTTLEKVPNFSGNTDILFNHIVEDGFDLETPCKHSRNKGIIYVRIRGIEYRIKGYTVFKDGVRELHRQSRDTWRE